MTKRQYIFAGLILLLLFAFQVNTIRPGHDWGDDFAQYLLHAQNLVSGRPYADTGYILNPENPGIGPIAYPPVFPALLAPFVSLFGVNLYVMKVFESAVLIAAVGVFCLSPALDLAFFERIIILLLLGLNPDLTDTKNAILSDLPSLMFIFLALNSFQQLIKKTRPHVYEILLTTLFVFLAIATRSAALSLLPAFLVSEWLSFRRLPRNAILICLAVGLLSIIQSILIPTISSYFSMFRFDPGIFLEQAGKYAVEIVRLWKFGDSSNLIILGFLIFIILAIPGWLAGLGSQASSYSLYAFFYAVLICIWPSYQGERFIFSLAFLSIYFVFKSIQVLKRLIKRFPIATLSLQAALCVFLLFANITAAYQTLTTHPVAYGVEAPEAQALFNYIRQNTSLQDVLFFYKPRAMALFTGRHTMGFTVYKNDDALWNRIKSVDTHFLVAELFTDEYYTPEGFYLDLFAKRYPDKLRLVYSNSQFNVYQIL